MKKVVPVNKSYGDLLGQTIENTSYLSSFQILQILQNKEYYYNIWRTVVLSNDSKELFRRLGVYQVEEGDQWDTVAWKLYKSVHYWWILAFFNDTLNPFETLYTGQILQILNEAYVQEFLKFFYGVKNK